MPIHSNKKNNNKTVVNVTNGLKYKCNLLKLQCNLLQLQRKNTIKKKKN